MKLFIKIFFIVLLVDLGLGFSMTYIVGSSEPSLLIHIIDEIISFPTSLWNRLFPDQGVYRRSSNFFWLVVAFNALIQALVVFLVYRLLKKKTTK